MKKNINKNINKKGYLIVAVLIVVILTATITIAILNKKEEFEYSGWIDCMPMLSDEAAELCRRAEKANYPYITY